MREDHLWRVQYRPVRQKKGSQKGSVQQAKFQIKEVSPLNKKSPSQARLEAGFNLLQALAKRVKPLNYTSSNVTSDSLQVQNHPSPTSSSEKIECGEIAIDQVKHQPTEIGATDDQRDRLRNEVILTGRKNVGMYRRASSFEKKLSVAYDRIQEKHVSKMQNVKELMQEYSQWAFDSKFQQDLEDLSSYEVHRSVLRFQRKSLKRIAQNLNKLNSEIDNIDHQKIPNKLKFPIRGLALTSLLQIKLQPCEMRQESLSETNLSEATTPDEVIQLKKEKMNYMSTKTQVRKMSDQEDKSSSCFSDAYSSLTRRDSQANKKVLISQTSIKGIYKSIRKLTQDLIQSENSTVLNDTDYVSIGKESPAFSGEKKFKPTQKVSAQYILPYSNQDIVKATDICKQHYSQDIDRLYHSNHDQKNPSFLQKQELFHKLNTTHEFNPSAFYKSNKNKERAPRIKHSEFFSKVLAQQLHQEEPSPNRLYDNEAFNFEGNSFYPQLDDNQENIRPYHCYRKSTQDDSLKISFLGQERTQQLSFLSNNSNTIQDQATRK